VEEEVEAVDAAVDWGALENLVKCHSSVAKYEMAATS
jgi:hypothetical protein